MTINHIDQLTEWWEGAAQVAPMRGDLVIEDVTDEDGPDYRIRNWPGDMRKKLSCVRVLTPRPKPAWHDAVAVMARCWNAPEGHREPFIRSETTPDVWIGEGGNGYTDDLRDVTPLIEQKVTEEARDRLWKTIKEMDWDGGETRFNMRADIERLLTVALGLETE